jgi:hypothetical protein
LKFYTKLSLTFRQSYHSQSANIND